MTTLTAGQSATVSLKDQGVCAVATNGGMATVAITPVVGSVQTVSIGPLPTRQSFGPYAEGATLVISSQTTVLDYDQPGGNAVTAYVDPVTGGIELPGVFNESEVAGIRKSNRGMRPRVLVIGDSIPGSSYYPDGYFSNVSTSNTPYGAGAFSLDGVSWGSGSGSGTLYFDKAAKTLKWAPAASAGEFGIATDVSRAGRYRVPGPSAGQWIDVVCRPRLYPGSTEGGFTVTTIQYTEVARYGAKAFPSYIRANTGYDVDVISHAGSRITDVTESLWQVVASGVTYAAIVIHVGTNDVAQDSTTVQMSSDLYALISAARVLCARLFVNTILPRSAAMTTARRQALFGINAYLYSLRVPGVVVVDVFTPTLDTSSASSDPLPGVIEDGVHPSQFGAEIIGRADALALLEVLGSVSCRLTGIADSYDAALNPTGNAVAAYTGLTGTGGTVGTGMTGPLSDGFTIERVSGSNIAAEYTKVTNAALWNGSAGKISVVGSTSRQTMQLRTSAATNVNAGEKWIASCWLYLEGLSWIESVGLIIDPAQPNGEKIAAFGTGGVAALNVDSRNRKIYLETPVLEIPSSGITVIRVAIRIISSAAGTGSVYLLPCTLTLCRKI